MSTTIEAPAGVDALVQQPERAVLFVSRRNALRLVKIARYPLIAPQTGQRLGETRGVTVSFAPDGEFRCPSEGEVTIMDPGGAGQATLPAEELLTFLENHPRCGDPNEGFQRVDPKAPPISQIEQERIVTAATMGDVATLEAIIAQETAGWDRKEIVAVASGAIDRIRETEDRIRADEREAQERAREADRKAEARVVQAEQRAAAAEKALADSQKPKAK